MPLIAHTAPAPVATQNTGAGERASVLPRSRVSWMAFTAGSIRVTVPSLPSATHTEPSPTATSETVAPRPEGRRHLLRLRIDSLNRVIAGVCDRDRSFADCHRDRAPAGRDDPGESARPGFDHGDRIGSCGQRCAVAAGEGKGDSGRTGNQRDGENDDGPTVAPARGRAAVRADCHRFGWVRLAEPRIVLENRAFEALECLSRLELELPLEQVASLPVGVECLCLPAGAIEREHQLATNPVAERIRPNERIELPPVSSVCLVRG